MDRNQTMEILKRSFPTAKNVKIVHDVFEDGDLHFTSNINRYTVE